MPERTAEEIAAGLHPLHARILALLHNAPSLTRGQIADALQVTYARGAGPVSWLAGGPGLLKRTGGDNPARWGLTDLGRAVAAALARAEEGRS